MKPSSHLFLILLLTACTTGPAAIMPSPSPAHTVLEGTHWNLISLNGHKPLDGTTITLSFASGILRTLSGSDGCNTYGGGPDSGPYQATIDGGLAITHTAVTAMLCLGPPGITEQETAYMGALQQAATYRVTNGKLEILNAAGDLVLVYERGS
jgi:heat shock protein HslJ